MHIDVLACLKNTYFLLILVVAPGPPTLNPIAKQNGTSIPISWKRPSAYNGVLRGYSVHWQRVENDRLLGGEQSVNVSHALQHYVITKLSTSCILVQFGCK